MTRTASTASTATTALAALQAERAELLAIADRLSADQWSAPSGCPGWSVQDVVTHVGALFGMLVDPSRLPDAAGAPTEAAAEVMVAARRSWSAAEVVDDYRTVSEAAVEHLAALAGQDFELPLGDLGTYRASLLANAYSFDHYTHLRFDLFAPRGPLAGPPPATDELRLAPAFEWISAALPQQNEPIVSALPGAVDLRVEGGGIPARSTRLGSGHVVATVTSAPADFVRWVTRRGRWEELDVRAEGDDRALASVRNLHVF